MQRRLTALGICAVLAATACGQDGSPSASAGAGDWRELTGSPLVARRDALGLWTGREALFIGGADDEPCPVNADCPMDATPLSDGAALDPRTGTWRAIADAPVPLAAARGAVVGQTAYVLPGPVYDRAVPDEVLAYDVDKDRWSRLPTPFGQDDGYALLAAGTTLVAYGTSDEAGPRPDYALAPGGRTWRRLPADPLQRSYDRAMAWTGEEVVLFDKELVPNPGATRPAVARAAVLSLAAGAWRRLPDSEILSTSPWLAEDGRLTNATLGGSDGGEVGNYGRVYPYGGVLDAAAGEWAALPDPPAVDAPAEHRAAAIGAAAAVYPEPDGPALNVTTGEWLSIPPAPGGRVTGRTVVAAGTDLLVFGGAAWESGGDRGALLDQGWLWSPPR
jgi:hypothetical protein